MTVITAPDKCRRCLDCWCHPQIVVSGYVGHLAVANLQCNDLIGAYLGTYASARLWDATWKRT